MAWHAGEVLEVLNGSTSSAKENANGARAKGVLAARTVRFLSAGMPGDSI